MWDRLWINGRLATMAGDAGFGLIDAGAVASADGRIAWVGAVEDLPSPPQELAGEVHDLGGHLITPGLVDPHTHFVYWGDGAADFEVLAAGGGRPELEAIGGGVQGMVRITRQASEPQLYDASAGRLRRLIAAGVTTVESKSGGGLDMDTELRQLRVNRALGRDFPVDLVSTFLGAHGLAPEYAGRRDAYVDFLCDAVLPAAIGEALVDQVDGFCDAVGFSHAQMARQFDIAAAHDLPVKLHADQYSDFSAGALVARYRGVSADHLEYASPETVAAMAAAGTVATLLPGAHWTLHETRKPPVALFRELRVPMALATNCNPVSSPTTSPTRMMHMACHLFGLSPEEALAGFTRNGARALGLQADRGTLEKGKLADLAVWDARTPVEIMYPLDGGRCLLTVKRGQVSHDAGIQEASA